MFRKLKKLPIYNPIVTTHLYASLLQITIYLPFPLSLYPLHTHISSPITYRQMISLLMDSISVTIIHFVNHRNSLNNQYNNNHLNTGLYITQCKFAQIPFICRV